MQLAIFSQAVSSHWQSKHALRTCSRQIMQWHSGQTQLLYLPPYHHLPPPSPSTVPLPIQTEVLALGRLVHFRTVEAGVLHNLFLSLEVDTLGHVLRTLSWFQGQ